MPGQYLPLMPCIILPDSREFMQFMKAVFGAVELLIVRYGNGGVMRVELRIDDAAVMCGESSDEWKEKTAGMFIYVENVDSVYPKALEYGATGLIEPRDTRMNSAASRG